METYLTPWNIGGTMFGFSLGVAAIVSLVMNRRQIGAALTRAAQHLFSPVGFFGLVIVVFLIISVLEGGAFFNDDITHGAIFGLLGYALALGFDLVSIVCMQARLNATRMRDERGARLNLVGVCICAAVSAFANVAGALQGYHATDLNRTPAWIQFCAPWTSMVFPLLIVVLSMTTDHILDHTPARGIDITVFRERERKRVEMLQVRLETERELLTLDTELSTLRHNREQASGKVQREWIFWRWLRPVAPGQSSIAGDELKTEIDQAVQATRAALEAHLVELSVNLHTLSTWSAEVDTHLHTLHTQMSALQEQERTLNAEQPRSSRAGARTRPERIRAHGAQRARTHDQQNPGHRLDADDRDHVGERVLETFHQLGASATDTNVARASGYSRTTVARWRKRFVEQGQLVAASERVQLPLTSESEAVEEPGPQNQSEPAPIS